MSPSRLFILRPVATTLLMAAIMLVGLFAYRFLPLSALPEVDYPTIQVQTFYPGASPDVMTSLGHRTARSPVRADAGAQPNVFGQLGRGLGHHPAVQSRFDPRRRRAGSPGGDQRRRQPVALGPAGAADLRQGQPRRRARPDLGADLKDPAAHPNRGFGRHPPRPENLPVAGGGPRQHQRRQPPGGPGSGKQPAARGLRAQHRRFADHPRQRQRQHAKRKFRRAEPGLYDQRQRPDPKAERIQRPHHRLSQRLAGQAFGCGAGQGGARKHQARRLGQHRPGDHRQHPAPARRQRHRRRRQHPKAVARAEGVIARRRRRSNRDRPHDDDPGLGVRCRVRARARGRCWW